LKQGQTTVGASEFELLGRLTGFNTVSSRSNLEMIEFIRSYLAGLGVKSVILPDETGKKASLLATIGPVDKAGYVLSGHTDVVPVEGQEWSRDRSPCGVMAAGSMAAAFPT
jgi:acetylornithine deacetylase